MAIGKTPESEVAPTRVSAVMTVKGTSAAVSAINRLRTLEDSVRINVRGERSAVLQVLKTVTAEQQVADSVQIGLLTTKSAALKVLQGLPPGTARAVSSIISVRGGKPVGG